ncbi:nuclear receptor coactivator [Perilla frutescens var. hirtella]|nr:nuclear receptor coactivator [Perilla frutescens var. hirtella]
MGISFKVSKTGKRFRSKPLPSNVAVLHADDEEANDAPIAASKSKIDAISFSSGKLGEARENNGIAKIGDNEVSFTLNLFPDGYSIGKPVENDSGNQASINVPKFLHPYDRASEALFSAIESGRLPGDILDDIPCKYIDGTLVCEVRDYRKCFPEGANVASSESSPVINRVSLKMSLENIVKDIPAISENGWTYGDLMEVESRILKAIQPQLSLDPTPQLDRLSGNPVQNKLNLELRSMRRKRLSQIPEVVVSSNNNHGKKVCLDRVPESSRLGDTGTLVQQPAYENTNNQNTVSSAMLQLRSNSFGSDGSLLPSPMTAHPSKYMGVGSPRMMKDQRTGALLNASAGSPGGQDMMIPFADNVAASIHGKRENQDGQSSPLTNKKGRLMHTGAEGNIQHLGPHMDTLNGSELHWKNTLMQQQQSIGRGIPYANNGMQKFSQQVFEGGINQEGGPMPFTVGQQGIRYNLKEEPVDAERLDKPDAGRVAMGESELTNIDSQQARLQQRMPHQMMRSSFPQSPWPLDNNSRKEDPFQKRKMVQSPHVSAGGLPQSPLSSKSGEFSSGSIGHQFGAVVTSGLVSSQKEKPAVSSVPPVGVGGNPSFTSTANDSVQRQNQAQAAAKRRSNSLPKTPAISGVGSPASVGNMSVPINASSPPVGTQPLGDQTTLERFSKIEIVAMRLQLNCKKSKVDEYPMRKPNAYSGQQLMSHLSSDSNSENLKDETCKMPLSKSLVGGNMNTCKTRILNFIQTERILQGNSYQLVPKARTRMIMSEKPNDGAVAIHIGEIEDAEYLAAEDYLPTLPNTHMADLLAAQYSSLMTREGYHVEDLVQPKPVRMNPASGNQPNTPGIPSTSAAPEMQQFSEGVSLQPSGDVAKPSNSGNAPVTSSQNVQGPRMLPPGSTQAIQMSQGLLPGGSVASRPQQPEQLPPLQQQPQQPQQHPPFQRSPMMLPTNPMQHLNNIAQNANMQLGPHMMSKTSALQLQLLQQQQQQQQQPSQLLQPQQQQQTMQRKMMPGLGNVGMGGSNMMGLGGLGNVMGIGGARGVGGSGISAPMGTMSNIGNMSQNPMNLSSASNLTNAIRSGALTPQQAAYVKLKFASQNQNRSNILGNPQQGIGGIPGARQMHPGGSGLSMLGSALNRANMNQMQRTAMGPPKVQPMSQRTPMSPQLSSGAIHPMAAGNPEACPPSPQLSSQTLGSVSSITNSPMELQGVNKSNSVNNAQ